jgi:hypothetical protein
MLFRDILICLQTLGCFFFCASIASGLALGSARDMPEKTSEAVKMEFQQELKRIESLSAAKDFDALTAAVDEIERKWRHRSPEFYSALMLKASDEFGSRDFGDAKQYDLEQKYAGLGLKNAGHIPLETELRLILRLERDREYSKGVLKGGEWAMRRTQKAEMWLGAWHRLESQIDTDWDPGDKPLLNVATPLAAGLPAGVAPEAIKDPELRAQYEEAIRKNNEKAERYRKQYGLRQMRTLFSKPTERYIIRAYSRPPFNLEELKGYLKTYIVEEDVRARILDAVRQNTSPK